MISIYQGKRRQRGYGVGGNFASFFRKAVPLLKTAGLTAGKEALKAGSEALDDIEKGDMSLKTIAKIHAKRAAFGALDPAISMGAELAKQSIKDIFSDDITIQRPAKKAKTSPVDNHDDIFSD